MKRKFQRLSAFVLVLLLLASLLPSVFASEADPATPETVAAGNTITITEKNDFYIGYTEFYYHQYVKV